MDKVKGNAPWIISELYRNKPQKLEPQLLEQYMYLGKNYKLEVINNPELTETKVKMLRGKLVVETYTESKVEIRQAIIKWYEQKVIAKLKERLKIYKEAFEIIPQQIEVVDNESILFRANEAGITVNVRIGMIPVDVIDYIVLSSLCRINSLVDSNEIAKIDRDYFQTLKKVKYGWKKIRIS